MTSVTVAVVCLPDPLSGDEVARLATLPVASLPGGAVMAFPTATVAARTMQDLRARRPFTRAAIEVTEAPAEGGRPLLGGLSAVDHALEWAVLAPPGVVLVSDLARRLLTASADLRCEPVDTQDGVH